MKIKTITLFIILLATEANIGASPEPTVESKGAFIKIAAGDRSVDIPAELNPPLLLFIRKSSILRVAMTFSARSVTYEVAIAAWGPDYGTRFNNSNLSTSDTVRVFTYRFAKEASATSFCEALMLNQEG
jgi:hypothetical protein